MRNQVIFLRKCIEEQVLPRSAPRQLQSEEHPLTNAARAYSENAVNTLSYKATILRSCFQQPLPRHLQECLQHSAETVPAVRVQFLEDSWKHRSYHQLVKSAAQPGWD